MRDVVIVGGGPAGSRSALLLAKDRDVVVLENHPESGLPLECTGLVSPDVIELSGVRPTVLNTFSKADMVFPDGSVFPIECRKPAAVLIDRSHLDRLMAEKAQDAGAEFVYSERCSGYSVRDGIARVATEKGNVYESRITVGADGHTSFIRRSVCSCQPEMVVRGVQADLKYECDVQDTIKVIMGSDVAPGFFAWVIPYGDMTRVGMCSEWSYGAPKPYFTNLLKKLGLSECEMKSQQAGKIPLGRLERTYFDNTILIGDAACHVKPVSGGGLYPLLRATPCLAESVNAAFEKNDFSASNLSGYQRSWEKNVGKELSRGFKLRKMYNNLSDEDLNSIFRIVDKPFVHEIASEADIDRPSDLYGKVMRHPLTFMKLLPYLRRRTSR